MSLTAAELAGMQSTLDASLPDRCSIDHVTKVADGSGGRTDSVVTTENVPCRFVEGSDKKGGELVVADVLTSASAWIFTFAAGTVIDVPDRIRVGSRTWEVVEFYARTWEIDLRLFAREIR